MSPRRLVKYILYFQGRNGNDITRGGSVCMRVCVYESAREDEAQIAQKF